jgi:hypothetical protein
MNMTGQRPFFPSICISLMVIFCFSLQVFGIDRDRGIDQLYYTSWTNQDGAPGEVRAGPNF